MNPYAGTPGKLLTPSYVVIDAGLLLGYVGERGHHFFAAVELPPFAAGEPKIYGTVVHQARAKASRALVDMMNSAFELGPRQN